eukprot:5514697-Pleurochrysis_carterae.AAC.1
MASRAKAACRRRCGRRTRESRPSPSTSRQSLPTPPPRKRTGCALPATANGGQLLNKEAAAAR